MTQPIKHTLVQIVGVGLIGVVSLFGYAVFAEHRAEGRAKAFCGDTRLGETLNALRERAVNSGADRQQTRWIEPQGESRWLAVTFIGFTPISKHICSVEATDTVKNAKYVHLD
jgi:hypothetical protein